MAAPVPLHADRGDGRTYTAADRCRSGKTSTHGGLTDGHLKLHPDLHHLDGRDPAHYRSEAAKFRLLAQAEPVERMRLNCCARRPVRRTRDPPSTNTITRARASGSRAATEARAIAADEASGNP